MNTADVGMNDEASASNGDQNTENLSNSPKHNDCGKHCSLAVGGARPKVRNLVCNIPNGINSHLTDDAAKVNNNVLPLTDFSDPIASGSGSLGSSKLHNGVNLNCANGIENSNGIDTYLRNNVNCHTNVDKCPLKVRSCSNKDNSLELAGKTNGYRQESQYGRVTRGWNEDDDSSSDTGNEGEDGLSADECCIYTYKGDQMADLPSSFFTLDVLARGGDQNEGARREDGENEGVGGDRNGGGSSPEMDFLEMDFDPGPSCEQDSEDDSDCCDIQDEEAAAVFPGRGLENHHAEPLPEIECHNDLGAASRDEPMAQHSHNSTPEETPAPPHQPPWSLSQSRSTDANLVTGAAAASSSSTVVPRTTGCWPARDSWGHHCTSGDLCSPGEASDLECDTWGETLVMWNAGNLRVQSEGGLMDTRKYNLHSALYHCIMAKRLVLDKQASFPDGDESNVEGSPDRTKFPLERTMIWSEQEACVKQVTQISTSACGATAVINVLLACKMPCPLERVKEGVNTRLRAESAPIPEYLFSRSVAGATHVDIIRGLEHASDVPDAWHHQMVFGVGPRGIYLTNPVECVSEAALWPQLCSPSVLMVRRNDILAKWNDQANLRPLMNHPDIRWKKMNVLGQVVNIIRESTFARIPTMGWVVTQHVSIPAAYSSGITLAIRRESPAYEELRNAPELPLLQQQQVTSKWT
ncbi:hypothetical protein C0J52_07998 [Blattella germanica]|nr:hypothetical protein C0J52_07998 [Blattella germanica]